MTDQYRGQPESAKLNRAITRALDTLGPIRVLEILGDNFLTMSTIPGHDKPYLAAIDHISKAMGEFPPLKKEGA